jgi:putative tryptophan/tyrosine transport system substrate-binding protein
MKRRQFIAGMGSTAAAWPLAARAQPTLPVVGVLYGGTAQPDGYGMAALRKGLSDTGFVEGKNVQILYLGAEWRYDRLPALAAEQCAAGLRSRGSGARGVVCTERLSRPRAAV